MNWKNSRVFTILSLCFFFIATISCEEETPSEEVMPAAGALVVSVLMEDGKVIPNASVSTEPSTQGVLTDSSGVAIIENIEAGNYLIRVESEGVVGTGSAEVQSGTITNITIRLMLDEEADQFGTGVLFIRVLRGFSVPVNGALVETNPESTPRITDALGSAVLRDLEKGIYVVEVSHPEFGSANGIIEVKPGESSNLTLQLIFGVFLNPQVQIESPVEDQKIDLNEELTLRG